MANAAPLLTDRAVRRALTLATDRAAISEQFYDGPRGEPPTANVLAGIPALESPNTSCESNLEEAAAVLDEVAFATAINAVLQKI